MNEFPASSGGVPPLLDPSAAHPRRVPRWRWWIHLFLIAAYPVFIGIVGWVESAARGPALSTTARGLLVASGLSLLVFGFIFGLAWLASRASRDDLLLRWRNGFWPVPLGIGYSVVLRIGVGIVVAGTGILLVVLHATSPQALRHFFMANRPDVQAIVDVAALRDNPLYFWLIVTFVSFVLAGLREELWRSAFLGGMRSVLPKQFGSRSGQVKAAAVAAVIFGFGHLPQGVLAMGMAGLLGFGLGLIMIFHRSIWPAVFAHGMFDATSLALLPWVMGQVHQAQPWVGH